MVDLAEVDGAHAERPVHPGRSWRFWTVLGAVVVLVAGAAITATAVSFRYLHAEPLASNGGGWLAPDSRHARDIRAGGYDASVIAPRPGHLQTFEVEVTNYSSVSQTVLGLTDGKVLADPRETGEPQRLMISANSEWPASGPIRYTSGPVTIKPHATYRLRLGVLTSKRLWGPQDGCRSEYWQGLSLQVRVGVFIRTEWVDFDHLIWEIRGPAGHC